ncbi:MAG: hypothetical protein ABSA33_01415 [Candidatus Micrarchaeaceae archaeon]|jgi:hypothetical protein
MFPAGLKAGVMSFEWPLVSSTGGGGEVTIGAEEPLPELPFVSIFIRGGELNTKIGLTAVIVAIRASTTATAAVLFPGLFIVVQLTE